MNLLRLAGRLVLAAVAIAVAGMVAIQYHKIVAKNLALAHVLRSERSDVAVLREKRRVMQHTIGRLSDPRGVVPEIHDRLHLVGSHEAIIYLKGNVH